MVSYPFNKSLRLLDASSYKSVFDDAKYKVSSKQVLYLARPSNNDCPRLGLVIAKKNVRHATQRNRIKRVIRESFRLNQHELSNLDTIILARRGLDKLDNTELRNLLDKLWKQLQNKAYTSNTSKLSKSEA